ncbi:MAG: VIT and vWA domain-containing protein [Phycisphaerales bacterium]
MALAAALPAWASGLLVPNDRNLPPLRITDHLVDVRIHDQVGLTTLTQTFRNDHNQRVEATYIFPLPEEADLTDFQMTFNGKMVEGEVLPAEEARQIYESIVRQARDPGLIEFIGRRLLRMRVFPIEPKSDTTIKISYQQILRPVSGMRGYHYPLRTSHTAGQAYGTVRFEAEIDSASAIKNIWSPTHAVEIVRKGDHQASIGYEASGGSLEEDFLLLYSTDDSDLGLSTIAHRPSDDEAGHFLMMLTPKQLWPEDEYTPQDLVFVLDTSGSMGGDNGTKLEQARKALRYCVGQLDKRDRFNVVRFSTGFDVLSDSLLDVSQANREKAIAFIDQFKAAGGTNIADTLAHVAGMVPSDQDRPFVVVFLTDGEGNRTPDEIMDAVKRAGNDRSEAMRIFPFGVGHDVNTALLDRLAGAYHGRPRYVQPSEDLELVLGDFFGTISQPVLTNLRLELPGIGVTERFPATLGDLYHGQQLTIAGRFSESRSGRVRLVAMRNGKEVEFTWPDVSFRNTPEAAYVPAIWAGRKIAFLLDQIRQHGEKQEMIEEVVALSQQYGIQTPYTSWLVNPEQIEVLTRRGRGRDDLPTTGMPDGVVDHRRMQERRLRSSSGDEFGGGGRGGGGGAMGGGGSVPPGTESRPMDTLSVGGEQLSYAEAEQAMRETSGRDATLVAEYQARLRDADSSDGTRLNRETLAVRKIGDRWFNRIGPFLVDQGIDEKTELLQVVFASDAYFELIAARPDLRQAFAASRNVAVLITPTHAVVLVSQAEEKSENPVSEAEKASPVEQFSDQQRELLRIGVRIDQ